MSPSGRLYLLTIVGLILPTRGQTPEEATSISLADSTTVNIHALTQTSDAVPPELQPTPQTSTLQAGVETPTQTQQLKGETVLLTTDPGTDESSTEGTTLSKQSPDKDFATDPARRPTDSSEDDPFSYDNYTLRKHGLLVAAVLFITGIVILTSGKCRQLPRLCRNHNRAYRVTKAQPEREDPDGARARTDGLNPLPSQPCLP
ncbi:FXYD domain-containing ion transport regulator 5 [Myotis daubentonii]|uniref:FXYD domain-containing ion transport regulator 5 n=1 Tax=Myotis daubentonii TaxID=98922 RepID=UPI0028733943|nr:FXYD domain-containing ion transport regulator 5 [Myotis daubentonii]XP_059522844.1 FXYD domain-containing ion transport regulator 5 [Myotis daubentonii]